MTSKLKCPVCNHELYQTASETATYCCLYKDCPSDFKFAGSKEIWQALIQAKQDLEIARKALEEIESTEWYDSMSSYEIMTFTAMKALKQIEHIADASKK